MAFLSRALRMARGRGYGSNLRRRSNREAQLAAASALVQHLGADRAARGAEYRYHHEPEEQEENINQRLLHRIAQQLDRFVQILCGNRSATELLPEELGKTSRPVGQSYCKN